MPHFSIPFALAAGTLLALPALAQDQQLEHATPTTGASAPAPEAQPLPRHGAEFTVTPFASHTFEADFSDGPGSVSISRAGAEISYRQPLNERTRLTISLGTELSFYDFATPSPFASSTSKPWEDTTQVSLTAVVTRDATEKWSWFFGGGIDTAFEDGADVSRSFTGGLLGGAAYKFSDRFTLGGGFAVRSRLEDSGLFLPILNLNWQICDQWRLSNFNQLNSVGLALTYTPTKNLDLALRAAYESRAYRLDEDGPFPDGVGRDQRIPIWVQGTYRFTPHAALTASVGYAVWQEFTIDDSEGVEIGKQEADPTPFVGVGFSFSF